MLLALLAGVDSYACESTPAPMLRVCVESVTQQSMVRWELQAAWPPVEVWTEEVSISTVRILPTREPSWMWGRPLLNPPQPYGVRFEVASLTDGGMPTAPGAVLYLDSAAIDRQLNDVDPERPRFRTQQCDGQLNVLQVRGEVYELELCPELRQALATR